MLVTPRNSPCQEADRMTPALSPFEAWWGANRARFLPYARRSAGGDAELGEDALQEAGIQINRNWDQYAPVPQDQDVRTIIRSRARDILRRRRRLYLPGDEH